MSTPNKQPIFTTEPILQCITFNPDIINNNYDAGNLSKTPAQIFYSRDYGGEGCVIDRITISATAELNNTSDVSAKLVYLYTCYYNDNIWNLYKVGTIPYTLVSPTVPNPEIVWTFDGGLTLPTDWRLGILASVNYGTNNYYGDYLSVTVEGSSLTAV
jgi:hypothetical protein